MHALAVHPFVQAILIPFLVALLVAELLQRLRLSGLAIIAGFALTIFLMNGFAHAPLTGTRKIIWIGIASGAAGIALNLVNWTIWRAILSMFAAASAVWVTLPWLLQHGLPTALQWGAGAALFTAWMTYWMDTTEGMPVRAASAGMALGLGCGLALYLGNAHVLGKMNLALGSAAFAILFLMSVSNSLLAMGRAATLPLALVSSISVTLGIISGKFPWYIAAPLALIPPLSRIPLAERSAVWVQATAHGILTLVCAAVTVYLSWSMHGRPVW